MNIVDGRRSRHDVEKNRVASVRKASSTYGLRAHSEMFVDKIPKLRRIVGDACVNQFANIVATFCHVLENNLCSFTSSDSGNRRILIEL